MSFTLIISDNPMIANKMCGDETHCERKTILTPRREPRLPVSYLAKYVNFGDLLADHSSLYTANGSTSRGHMVRSSYVRFD